MAQKNLADLQCKNTVWLTPDSILDKARNYFGGKIPLDPATEPNNPTKASAFGCKDAPAALLQLANAGKGPEGGVCLGDGLAIRWSQYDGTFVNPPYGREIRLWCRRIHEEASQGAVILALLPAGARFSTKYFQDYILTSPLNAACFIRGRVKFKRPNEKAPSGSNPYDSVIYGFNVDQAKFLEAFDGLGSILKIST